VVDIEDYLRATSEIAKTTLRSVLGKAELDSLLSDRERLNEDLQRIIDEQTEPWGIKVVTVEIKDVGIPQDMQRAMARQAEAERDRRAKVINAEAEFQAAARIAEAAHVLAAAPEGMQLRYLQTLAEVGKGEGATVLLPLPLDVIGSLTRPGSHNGRGHGTGVVHVD
jgi:regulator of protease activity HflC (stomatin/prohibitin superfamily)